jgi:hypothetical protein
MIHRDTRIEQTAELELTKDTEALGKNLTQCHFGRDGDVEVV